jgi:MFS family permease
MDSSKPRADAKVKGSFFYGWWIVASCLTGLVVAGGSGFYCFGVFFPRLMQEFHWSRAASAAAMSIYWVASGMAGPVVGPLIDRYGPKRVMIAGTIIGGVSLVMLSLTRTLPYFYSLYGLLAVSHTATVYVPYAYLISNWFIKQRGKAMGIATTGISLGGIFFVPLNEVLVRSYGWRGSYIILGITVVCILMPIILFVVRTSPREVGCLPDGVRLGETPFILSSSKTPRQASQPPLGSACTRLTLYRTRTFWLMFATLLCMYMVMFGVLTHLIPFVLDMGISSVTAAFALSFTALVGIAGKLAIGFIADRFSVKTATILMLGLQLASLLILMGTGTLTALWISAIVFGFSMGGATLRPLLPTWLFGLSSLGALQGAAQMATSAGSAVGPFLAGYIFDISGSYQYAFFVFALFCGIGLLAIGRARPSQRPQSTLVMIKQ